MNRYVNIGLAFGMSAFLGAAARSVGAGEAAEPAKPSSGISRSQAGSAVNLGAVRIPRAVKADGEALAAGTYQVRVTETPATPQAAGQTPQYERWAEFMRRRQGGGARSGHSRSCQRHQAGRRTDAAACRRVSRPKCSRVTITCGCGSTAAGITTWCTSISELLMSL